jgi:Icc-related predicted phosphoesterase
MKICVISDTHNKHQQLALPEADVIIHCGDFTSMGKEHEIINFFKWYAKLNFIHKIIIAGNHDWLFETNTLLARTLVPADVHYLEDSGVEIEGVKFYGSPVSKPFCNWAFNRDFETLEKHWKAIPDDVDVLITHTPPNSIHDFVDWDNRSEGSGTLRNEVLKRIKPRLHLMGHIHEGRGHVILDNILFINASNLNRRYECVNKPYLVELNDDKIIILDE